MNLDAEKVINNLLVQLSQKNRETAMLSAQVETLQEQLQEATKPVEKEDTQGA